MDTSTPLSVQLLFVDRRRNNHLILLLKRLLHSFNEYQCHWNIFIFKLWTLLWTLRLRSVSIPRLRSVSNYCSLSGDEMNNFTLGYFDSAQYPIIVRWAETKRTILHLDTSTPLSIHISTSLGNLFLYIERSRNVQIFLFVERRVYTEFIEVKCTI